MSTVRVATNFNIDIEFTAPPFYRRLLAWVVDIVILIFYLVIITNFMEWFDRQLGYGEDMNVV